MEPTTRIYGRYHFAESALETWRQHACLPKLSPAQREASYAAATPLLAGAAHTLQHLHAWRAVEPPSAAVLFCIEAPRAPAAVFTLPTAHRALFEHAAACARMCDAVFDVRAHADDRPHVAEPLADVFHLLQLLAPGCLTLVQAEYAAHDVDDDGDVAWITWRTYERALPPAPWMDLYARQLTGVFGESRWATLRRAVADSEVLTSGDLTFR